MRRFFRFLVSFFNGQRKRNKLAWECYRACQAEFKFGNLESALNEIDMAVELAPDQIVFLMRQGIILFKSGRFKEAKTAFSRAVILKRDSQACAAALLYLGQCYYQLGDPDLAIDFLRAAYKIGSQFRKKEALRHRILIHLERGDLREARGEWESSRRDFPGEKIFMLLEPKLLAAEGKSQGAIEVWDWLARAFPGDTEVAEARNDFLNRFYESRQAEMI